MHHSQLIFVTRRIVKAPSFCGGLQDLATATCEEAVDAHRIKEKDVNVRPLPSETPSTCGLVRVPGHLQEFSGHIQKRVMFTKTQQAERNRIPCFVQQLVVAHRCAQERPHLANQG